MFIVNGVKPTVVKVNNGSSTVTLTKIDVIKFDSNSKVTVYPNDTNYETINYSSLETYDLPVTYSEYKIDWSTTPPTHSVQYTQGTVQCRIESVDWSDTENPTATQNNKISLIIPYGEDDDGNELTYVFDISGCTSPLYQDTDGRLKSKAGQVWEPPFSLKREQDLNSDSDWDTSSNT